MAGGRVGGVEVAACVARHLRSETVWREQICRRGEPDGICLDAHGAVWSGDVPSKRCVRVREGGEVLETVELDRGCFACMLGGPDRRTLFMLAAEWAGTENVEDRFASRTGRVYVAEVEIPGAGWP